MKSGDFEGDLHVDVRLYSKARSTVCMFFTINAMVAESPYKEETEVLGFLLVRAQIIMIRTSIRSCVIHRYIDNCICKIIIILSHTVN